jgi:outer membrane lipoprotein-sorting protein
MSIFTSRPVLRWAVPAAAAVAVVGAGVAAKTLAAASEPDLAPRSAAQLLVDLQTAQLDGLSGTVVERADLGLPSLVSLLGTQGSSNLTSLVAGKHTLRVWYSGPDKTRVALVGTNGESDIIANGDDLWLWDSQSNTATHHVADKAAGDAKVPHALPSGLPSGLAGQLPKTPQDAADLALKTISPTTDVTTGNSARVAGRDAYELILSPKDTNSLVGSVRLAIDAKQHLPLQVQVIAKGQTKPSFEVGFTQVSFARPEAAQFQFTPPKGAKVQQSTDVLPGLLGGTAGKDAGKPVPPNPDAQKALANTKTTVIGKGWTAVFVARLGDGTKPGATTPEEQQAQSFLSQLDATGNGKALTSNLFTVMFTDDGRVLAGAVSKDRLAQVANDPAAQLK